MKTRPALLLLAALAAVCGAYANHFQNGFHFDDFHTVVDNPYIRDLANLPRFFKDPTTFSVLPTNRTYRPFVSASLALDYWLGHGYQPFWFHLSTFVVFLAQLALMAALFSAILDRTSPSTAARNRLVAIAAAAWYGLHPAIAETVNYVIQRGDVFCAFGVVAALALYAGLPRWRKTNAYLLPFVFALLSKPPALVFPVLLFLYILLFEEGAGPHRLRAAAAKVLPSLLVCGLLLWLQAALTPKSFNPSIHAPWAYRITQPYVWLRYCGALLLPIHLNVDTDLRLFTAVNPRMIAGLLFVAVLLAASWATARKASLRPIAFGLLWFVVAQLPTSLYPLSEVENDHRMYLSFIGLVLAVCQAGALGLQALLQRVERGSPAPRVRRLVAALILLLLGCYAGGTLARNRVWRDNESLWRDDVEKSPENGRGLMNYGLVLMGKGNYPAALELFTRALVYTPNYSTLEVNLGVVNSALGRAAEADRHFQRAIALAPTDDEAHFYWGRSLFEQHRLAEAKAHAAAAIAINPSRLNPHHLLMQIDQLLGDEAGAQAAATATLQLAPEDELARTVLARPAVRNASYWLELSLQQYQQKSYADCIQSARRALELKPDSAEAYNNIAAANAEEKRWDDAIRAAQRALELKPGFQLAKNNLAWAQSGKAALAR